MSFQYYNPHEFHDNHYINEYFSDKCFSALLCTAILGACPLTDLYLPVSIVGLTEIKLKVDQSFLSNIEIPRYSFSFQPSLSNAGGVGFYIKEDQLFTTRPDLTLSTDDFETLWVEMQNGSQRNMICGVIYWHPHGNMQNFMDFLNSTIEKIDRENKFYIILGDFNLDLLKLDSHPDIDNFLNTLGSFNFQPHILQPTRITDQWPMGRINVEILNMLLITARAVKLLDRHHFPPRPATSIQRKLNGGRNGNMLKISGIFPIHVTRLKKKSARRIRLQTAR